MIILNSSFLILQTVMGQVERIKRMERKLNRASKAVRRLSAALDEYSKVQDDLRELEAYYGSEDWKQDYADDEQGLLPSDLKRGVLAQDAIWNVLEDCSALKERCVSMA